MEHTRTVHFPLEVRRRVSWFALPWQSVAHAETKWRSGSVGQARRAPPYRATSVSARERGCCDSWMWPQRSELQICGSPESRKSRVFSASKQSWLIKRWETRARIKRVLRLKKRTVHRASSAMKLILRSIIVIVAVVGIASAMLRIYLFTWLNYRLI